MNRLNFRPQDWNAAEKLHEDIDSLQKELSIHLERGDYGIAGICSENINNSIKELCKIRHTKREHDRLVKIAKSHEEGLSHYYNKKTSYFMGN
ncbi:hypothetical protein [Rummeliibacillus pycnus]|uniref:hypothetical protein n=1 Tax=Rummeliibacillus pycnus TaxID=101070 RepID=UPI0037C6B282